MKTFILLPIVWLFFVFGMADLLHAQDTNVHKVILTIRADTNSIEIGSTVTLVLQVKNLSTNILYSINDYPLTNASLWLTNNAGKFYKLSQLHSPSWEKSFYHPQSHTISPGDVYEWSLALKVTKDIEPGSYDLKACRTVFTVSTNRIASTRSELESNLLETKIISN